jgi:pentatricopeptide repeat protein
VFKIKRGDFLVAMNTYKEIKANKLVPTEKTFAALLKAAINSKETSQVDKILEEARAADAVSGVVIWTELMRVYSSTGEYQKALDTFAQMTRSKIEADYTAWGVVLLAAAESKDPSLVEKYWKDYKNSGGKLTPGLFKTKVKKIVSRFNFSRFWLL